MQAQTILLLIIGIVVVSYLFSQFLDYINLRAQRKDIPDEIASFYDKEKYLKSLDYHREQTYFSFITSAFSLGLSLLMLLLGGFGWLDGFLRNYITSEIPLALAFFGILAVASDLITIPFQWYSTFVIEEKYGFNKTTIKTFITDKLKGYLLGAIIGGLLLTTLLYLVQ